MEEDKILEIFKKHSVYRDSEAYIKDVEMDAEDEDGNDLFYDEKYIVEDVGGYFSDDIQYIKLDFVKEIIKEAQIELIDELFNSLEQDDDDKDKTLYLPLTKLAQLKNKFIKNGK